MNALKPHYRSPQEAKQAMAQDIVPGGKFALPAHLQGKAKVANWGEIDPRQRLLPRIKLLQATSPECNDYPGEARAGEFWHTTLTTSLGSELIGVPIMRRQTYNLWAPLVPGEDRGILARARDFIHWDPPDGVFHVRFPMNPKTYTWKTARTVRESGLDQFGTSREDDPKSPPAATLTFEVLWYLPDWSTLALTLNTRSGVKEARQLFAMVDAKPTAPFFQRYKIVGVRVPGPTGESYFGYKYRGVGYTDEALSAITEPLFAQWRDVAFATADEDEDVDGEAAVTRRASHPPRDAMSERGARPVESKGESGVVDDDIPF
jgi:hypothetical protein